MTNISQEEFQAYLRLMEASNAFQELAARREMAEDMARAEGKFEGPKKTLEERLRNSALGIVDKDFLPFETVTEYSKRNHHTTDIRWAMERDLRQKIGVPDDWRPKEDKIAFYKRQLALLEKANAAPRCEHIYADGTRCGCPRTKKGRWCYAHERMKQVRPKKLGLLVMEDANCVILNIATLQSALLEGTITAKEAGLLFYSTQTGASVLPKVTFKETNPDHVVLEAAEEDDEQELRATPLIEGDAISDEEEYEEDEGEEVLEEEGQEESVAEASVDRAAVGGMKKITAGDELDKSNDFGDEGMGGEQPIADIARDRTSSPSSEMQPRFTATGAKDATKERLIG